MYDVHNFWFLDVTAAGQDRPQKDEGNDGVETNVSSCTPCNEDHNTPPEIPTRKGNYEKKNLLFITYQSNFHKSS